MQQPALPDFGDPATAGGEAGPKGPSSPLYKTELCRSFAMTNVCRFVTRLALCP